MCDSVQFLRQNNITKFPLLTNKFEQRYNKHKMCDQRKAPVLLGVWPHYCYTVVACGIAYGHCLNYFSCVRMDNSTMNELLVVQTALQCSTQEKVRRRET